MRVKVNKSAPAIATEIAQALATSTASWAEKYRDIGLLILNSWKVKIAATNATPQ
jgi:hypothetical protein